MTDQPDSQGRTQRRKTVDLFRISLPICAGIGLWGVIAPDQLQSAATALTRSTFRALDWFFLATVSTILIYLLWLASSSAGKIKLGHEMERPEFSTGSWLALLFAAGMGVGLLFWGVAEPVLHYASPPIGTGLTPLAARRAMVISGFHWGLHAWAIYAMAGLAVAYFTFRKGEPALPGAALRRVFEGRWVRPVAWSSDLLSILSVLFGLAGSISMGIFQLRAGLDTVFGWGRSDMMGVVLLLVLIVVFIGSAATRIDQGIKWLSNVNMVLATLLLCFVLVVGDTAQLLRVFISSVGDYLAALPQLSLQTYPYLEQGEWLQRWTLTYFVWWVAWTPFVGVFIGRISRGRTIREYVLGVLLVPSLFTLIWFSVFGGTALQHELVGRGGVVELVQQDVTVALFSLFDRLPLSTLLSITALLLDFLFLTTSADSATYVLGMLTSGGVGDPTRARRISWGLGVGILAGALMLSNSVDGIRSMAVVGAVPFTLVLLMQMGAVWRAISEDREEWTRS